jgi:hypothetical protein
MSRRYVLAVLAYLLPTFALGFTWHLVLFTDYYGALAMYRKDVIIPFGFASMFIQGSIFAALYPRLVSTAREQWLGSALKAGALFTLFSWSFTTLAVSAKNVMSSVPDYMLIETAFTVIQFALVMPLMALALRDPAA